MTASQIASWSLAPPLPDTASTFVDVMELTADNLRWLRERPTDPAVTPIPVTPPSVPDAVSPRLVDAQDALAALLAGGVLSESRADTEAVLRLAEQARAMTLCELAEMDAGGGHLSHDLRTATTESWLRERAAIRRCGPWRPEHEVP